ncbi:MAG: hypothetical protein IPN20_17375 [Haliscomenobacter sp.]|nr:hypothetical protein [Haliscomenobacter sp.]
MESEKMQLEAEKAVLEQALEEERDRFRRAIKGLMQRRSERYQTASINEEQLSLFAEQLVALAQSLQAQHTPLPPAQQKQAAQARPSWPPPDSRRYSQAEHPAGATGRPHGLRAHRRRGDRRVGLPPRTLFVRRFIRTKYARPQAEGMLIAPAPVRVIDKGSRARCCWLTSW